MIFSDWWNLITVFENSSKILNFASEARYVYFQKNLWWIAFAPCKCFQFLSVSGYLLCEMTWKNLKTFSRGKNESPKVSKLTSANNDKNDNFLGIFQHSAKWDLLGRGLCMIMMKQMSMKESILRFDSHLSFTALLNCFLLGNVEKYDCRSSSHTIQKI